MQDITEVDCEDGLYEVSVLTDWNWLFMAVNWWKWAEMAKNGIKLLKMARHSLKYQDILGGEYSLKLSAS